LRWFGCRIHTTGRPTFLCLIADAATNNSIGNGYEGGCGVWNDDGGYEFIRWFPSIQLSQKGQK
jgi:hypothetical protein